MQFLSIQNTTRPSQPIRVEKCDSFFSRLRGLMFRRRLLPGEGIWMVQPSTSRVDSSIHMMFMNFDLAVIWVDEALRVVDAQYCKRWRPAYIPSGPAKYVMELNASRLKDFSKGDQILVEPC